MPEPLPNAASATRRSELPDRVPDFLGLGAERAATTWLHNCLTEHPDLFLPPAKEIHYFSTHRDRGPEWYLGHFAEAPAGATAGEFSPSYLHDADPADIADLLPNARFVVILRQPVDRAFSAYQLYYRERPGVGFREACEESPHLLERSRYADRLAAWFDRFGRERVGVWIYEEVCEEPLRLYQEVCRHVGVRDDVTPEAIGKTFNRVLFPRLQSLFYRYGLGRVVSLVGGSPLGEALKSYARRSARAEAKKPARSSSDEPAGDDGTDENAFRRELAESFAPDADRLRKLLGRDLTGWPTGPGSHQPAGVK